jgi:small-conductance mechanosensitive channel
MEYFIDFFSRLLKLVSSFLLIFNRTLFSIGESEISIGTIIIFFLSFYLLIFTSTKARKLILNKILHKSKLKKSFRESIANGVRIAMMLIGTIIIIQAVGIDLSALSLLAGALGVGIGFGFQKVTDNLISGLTILVEEPIKVGDRVEVGDVSGDIVNISLRATTIITNDNISIIVVALSEIFTISPLTSPTSTLSPTLIGSSTKIVNPLIKLSVTF